MCKYPPLSWQAKVWDVDELAAQVDAALATCPDQSPPYLTAFRNMWDWDSVVSRAGVATAVTIVLREICVMLHLVIPSEDPPCWMQRNGKDESVVMEKEEEEGDPSAIAQSLPTVLEVNGQLVNQPDLELFLKPETWQEACSFCEVKYPDTVMSAIGLESFAAIDPEATMLSVEGPGSEPDPLPVGWTANNILGQVEAYAKARLMPFILVC